MTIKNFDINPIQKALEETDLRKLHKHLDELESDSLRDFIGDLDSKRQVELFGLLDEKERVQVYQYMDPVVREEVFKTSSSQIQKKMLDKEPVSSRGILIEKLLKPEVQELIEQRRFLELRRVLEGWEPIELAGLIDELSDFDDVIVFRLLPADVAADAFELLTHDKQEHLIEELAGNMDRLKKLLNELDPDDRTAFLEELPENVSRRFIQMLSPEERRVAMMLLGYPKESIGRLMTTDYVAVQPDFTIQQAFDHIRRFGKNSETLNVIYVVDEKGHLIDDLRVRELLLADPETTISDLLDERFVALKTDDDQETAVQAFRDYDRVALPVTDDEGFLLGIITVDDVLDVADEEAAEDIQKFSSVQEAVFDPLRATVRFLYQKRIVWLVILVFMNVFSGAAIATFEETIESMVALVFFLPLLIDSGGNAGSQSATLMVRALATGNVRLNDWFRLIGKELLVALLLGGTMAIGVAAVASFRAPEILAVVSLTMICIVLVGSLVGLTLPFLFTRFGFDPATASAPLITSIADISGVLIYFSIANWYLGM